MSQLSIVIAAFSRNVEQIEAIITSLDSQAG